MRINYLKLIILITLVFFGIISCINPIFPNEQLLQHSGTILLLLILIFDLMKNSLSKLSFIFLSIFIFFHIIGARYIYTYVPYDKWLNSILSLNISINERNHYDRFIHFIFGILAFPFLCELITKNNKNTTKNISILLTWAIIQSLSMFYELFEWILTLVLSSEAADNYNGQQGDIWDSHKDMSLAFFSSSIMAFVYLFKKKSD